MDTAFVLGVLFILASALIGGLIAKLFKLQPIVGYLLAGLVFGGIYSPGLVAQKLAEIGIILLLFSIGIELSFSRLAKVFKVVFLTAIFQMLLVTAILYFLFKLIGALPQTAIILAIGFSLSSTAVVVKTLVDRGEMETIHGELALGWLLIQDLAVIPILVLLPVLSQPFGLEMLFSAGRALGIASVVVILAIILGKLIVPYLLHKVAATNSRELLILSAVFLAVGTAVITSFFGISPALGAFLAGLVISESQENHAVFSEVRPLRDLFVAIFFVTLGFIVSLPAVFAHILLIIALVIMVISVKFVVIFLLTLLSGHRGKTAIALGLGLSQVGEFAFIIFSQAASLNLISEETASAGIVVALISLMITPLLFKGIVPTWRFLKNFAKDQKYFSKFIFGLDKELMEREVPFENHIIVCGYGRVGGWVGKALNETKGPFVVIEYDANVVNKLKNSGINVIYGDPTRPEVLEAAGIEKAKVIVVAIPDSIAQEELIAYVQTKAPDVKIISRVHQDEDWEKIKLMKVEKLIQPEFEAAVAINRAIFSSMGKSKEEISEIIKSLRISHTKIVK
jgi:CPA2 family monovalent cation:H+ antiporter-2